jgi:hypothetical protein
MPKCAACQFGKQTRKVSPGTVSSAIRDKQGTLKTGHLLPGQEISVDHFQSSAKGRLLSSAGRTSENEMFSGGCLFIDHASNFVYIEFQVHLSTPETLKAKENFELFCRDHGVIPQTYRSDNGRAFLSSEFTAHLSKFAQTSRFAGVGAHHTNGNAERAIRTIMSIARTMMLHAAVHWPEVADSTHWPMAVQHAVYLHNHVPNPSTGIAPVDVFTKTRFEQRKLNDLHVYGCPVYVLNHTIADGKKIPRWQPRSQRMINMGHSPHHASTVPLVLNPNTGYFQTPFNVVFDDWFATIATDLADLPDFNSPEWAKVFGDSVFQYVLDDDDVADMIDLSTSGDVTIRGHRERVAAAIMDDNGPPIRPLPVAPPAVDPPTPASAASPSSPVFIRDSHHVVPTDVPMSDPSSSTVDFGPPDKERMSPTREMLQTRETHPVLTPIAVDRSMESVMEQREMQLEPPSNHVDSPAPKQSKPTPPPLSPRRSSRTRSTPNRFGYDNTQGRGYLADTSFAYPCDFGSYNMFYENGLSTPFAYGSTTSTDPDTMGWDEAMRDTDRDLWLIAAQQEISALEDHGVWEEVDIDDAQGRQILPGTWVFRRKRSPDGEIRKYKARWTLRGDLEKEVYDTYAPVVAWSTVRIFLVLSMTLGWETCSIDFANAFVQAKLDRAMWAHLPRGFASTRPGRTCLRLIKSIYGTRIAPKLWFEHLFTAFFDMGFIQSKLDPCLLFKKDIMIVVYCDDCGIASKETKEIDNLIKDFERRGFQLTREGSFSEFLGIKFEKGDNGAISMTQKGLINKIIAATGMEQCNPNWTPATQLALGIDPDGEEMTDSWNYRSIVGMLLYLSTNTRCDISFAVSQVARFSQNPKKSHATAVKTIVRYLHRTRDKGTIVTLKKSIHVDCYVDADFGGLYRRDPDDEPSAVKSRSGWIIFLGNCPLIWKSQLMPEIALSTLEAEYQALSQSIRQVIPIRSLIIELTAGLEISTELQSTIHSRVFEDNNGALLLATSQRITSRTKYFLVKWHFFWEHVKKGTVSILKIDTKEQRADYLTTGLSREVFETIRKLVQGW